MSPFQNTYVCRLLLMLSKYFRLTNYTWMFCEGYYLHRLLANTFEEERSLGVILAIGWGEIYLLYIFWTFEKIWNYSKVYCMGCIHLLGAYLHASTVNIRRWEGDFSNHNWLHDYLVPPVHGVENCLWNICRRKSLVSSWLKNERDLGSEKDTAGALVGRCCAQQAAVALWKEGESEKNKPFYGSLLGPDFIVR